MKSLPQGWDIDYDGTRWFYKYRPSGLVQYTFPKDGDEFPEYVDDTAPALTLAPEERLESQQQMRRKGHAVGGTGRTTPGKRRVSGMGSTGGPVSTEWEDDGEGDEYFQPESFMFLGPGAYIDVSPLTEEENVAGFTDITSGKSGPPATEPSTTTLEATSDRLIASPPVSLASTPHTSKGTPAVAASEPVTLGNAPAEPAVELAMHTPPPPTLTPVESGNDRPASSGMEVPILDSRERPQERPEASGFDPVGFIAEMPTESTAAAHIELHPDPVEIGDNSVLAPIETFYMDAGIAELPSHSSPVVRQRETKQPPSRRQISSQPIQRVYPFQPTEEDDAPRRDPTPEESAPASQTHFPLRSSMGAPRDKNRGPSPLPPSVALTSEQTAPLPPTASKPNSHAVVVQRRSPGPQPQFKIARKPTNARMNSGFKPWSPGVDSSKPTVREGGQSLASQLTRQEVAPAGYPQASEERSHSSRPPQSEQPTAQLSHPDIARLQGVPSALQPGTPPSATIGALSKGKGVASANTSPALFTEGRAALPPHALGQVPPSMTPGPKPPADLNSIGASPPAQTTAPANTQVTTSPQPGSGIVRGPARPAGPNHPPRAGASSDNQSQDQRQRARSIGFQSNSNSGQKKGSPPVGQSHRQSVGGSYFPPQQSGYSGKASQPAVREERDRRRSLPQEQLYYMMGGQRPGQSGELPLHGRPAAQQPRPQATTHGSQLQQGTPRSDRGMTNRPQQSEQQPVPSRHIPPQDPALGHSLHSISEQPDHEDSATRATRVARLSRESSHRHSMPVIPLGQRSTHGGNAPGVTVPRAEMTSANRLGQQQVPGQGNNNAPNDQSQNQSQMRRGIYAQPPMRPPSGLPAGSPLALPPDSDKEPMSQAPEKGKSKWFSKFLKSSKTLQKPSTVGQQHIWQGPNGLIIPPTQTSGPDAPWSPGSIGAPMSLPASGAAQPQPGHALLQGNTTVQMQKGVSPGSQPTNIAQMYQQQLSGGQMGPPDIPPLGRQNAPGNPSHPPRISNVHQGQRQLLAPAGQPGWNHATSRPELDATFKTPSPHASPPKLRQSQSAVDADFIRTESVRSDFSTVDVSEARAQPVLKPQLVQVTRRSSIQERPQRQPQQGNGPAWPGQSSLAQNNG